MSGAFPRARQSRPSQASRAARKAPAMAGASRGAYSTYNQTASSSANNNNNNNNDGARLLDEWRLEVNRWRDDTDNTQQATAIILERLTNRLDEHDRRITALEQAPETRERRVTSYGGLYTQVVYVGIALVALVVSVASHISFH